LAITIPVGGLPHTSHYGWDQRSRISESSPLVKDGAAQDLGGNNDKRWPRAADSPGMWMGKRDGPGPGPSPTSLAGPNSPSKGSSAAAAGSWDRGRERSTEARSSKDTDQDARWQRGKDSPGHWMGKREGSGLAPMPSSPRVGDSSANWGPRGSSRASAWDQPPLPGEIAREPSSKDGPMPERDLDRSSAIRNLPDMREMRREPSPPSMRRRVPTPPRSMYSVDMRDRCMDMGVGAEVAGAGVEDYPGRVCDGRGKTPCCEIASRPSGTRLRVSCAPRLSAPRLSVPRSDQMLQSAPATLLGLAPCSISGIWARALVARGRSIGACVPCHLVWHVLCMIERIHIILPVLSQLIVRFLSRVSAVVSRL